jgi:hypothetical protein
LQPNQIQHKRILISPLNWGLGHVMRIIPLIEQLQRQDNTVFIACDATQQVILQKELRHIHFLPIEGYPFQFNGRSFTRDLALQFWSLFRFMNKETRRVDELVTSYRIELVISDQRPGFRAPNVPSIFLSHMLTLPLPGYLKPAQWLYSAWIKKFNFVWIPDVPGERNLSGKLSQTTHPHVHYIGWLSRFRPSDAPKPFRFRFGALISGPEPYRTKFRDEVRSVLTDLIEPSLLIAPDAVEEQMGSLTIFPHQSAANLQALLESAELIISRAGYSTLMDLRVLNKPAILIPTPGQHEQIYLMQRLKNDAQFSFRNNLKKEDLEIL